MTEALPLTAPAAKFIDEVIQHVPGWTPADQLLTLFTLACASTDIPGDILEVGSWCGRSTVVLAMACRLTGHGRVQSVDLFPAKADWFQNLDGTWSFKSMGYGAYMDQTVWDEPFQRDIAPLYREHDNVFEIMQESLKRFAVSDLVDCHKGTSDHFFASCGKRRFRLAFLDGDHSFDAVCRDITNAAANMPDGGWLCFDDAFSTYEGVDQAIKSQVWTSPRLVFARQFTRKLHAARLKAVE